MSILYYNEIASCVESIHWVIIHGIWWQSGKTGRNLKSPEYTEINAIIIGHPKHQLETIRLSLGSCGIHVLYGTCYIGQSVLTGSQRNLSRIASEFSKNHLLDMLTNFWLMICMNCMREEAKIFLLKLCEHHWFENFRTIVRIIEI